MNRLLEWIWIRIRRSTAEASIHSLGERSDTLHREAMMEPDVRRSADLRKEADYYADEQKEMREATHDSQRDKP